MRIFLSSFLQCIRFSRGFACFAFLVFTTSFFTIKASDALIARFEAEIYPLFQKGQSERCVDCHDATSSSNLQFIGNARDDFWMLLSGGYFETSQPDSLLARLTSSNPKRRMPKGKTAWSKSTIQRIESFAASIARSGIAKPNDEAFPLALRTPFTGDASAPQDTRFLSYTQLRGKVETLFGERWIRDGKDRFKENVALFGGADFETRFSESTQATSGYLSALRRMAIEVAERAYVTRSGPFAEGTGVMTGATRAERVHHLYRYLLHRSPLPDEIETADRLFEAIVSKTPSLSKRPYVLTFQVEAEDPITGLTAHQTLHLPVREGAFSVNQEWISPPMNSASDASGIELSHPFQLHANREDQILSLQLTDDSGELSFVGILLQHEDLKTIEWIDVHHPKIQLEGAWKLSDRDGYWSADSQSEDAKISVRLRPDFDGQYVLKIFFRPISHSPKRVLAELHHAGSESILVMQQSGPQWRDDKVHFTFDARIDTRPFVEFVPRFRFGKKGFVEINNADTSAKVVAGPMQFLGIDGEALEMDTKAAEGFAQWSPFKAISFNAYNRRGTRVEDRNERKGELFLRYFPARIEGWNPSAFYQLRAFYPGKRDHESETPLLVSADASSPILRLRYPVKVGRGNRVRLDASDSFTTQKSGLTIRWHQLGGLPVTMKNEGAIAEFEVPDYDRDYEFWIALTQGLMRQPDFLFTRSPALDWVSQASDRRRLQLSRLALDFVGRSPTSAEFAQFLNNWNWKRIVDYYLDSKDFERFYRHRVALYLESQGTEKGDEPVRLWCYVAFKDRPFQEILTGDYTVDVTMNRQSRPAYHGHTGLLTTRGFIDGKPGLPHYNYAAQVSMLFLGYRYEVPAEIVEQREGITALGTTDPNSACYSCHKILTPLAFQRSFWTDEGRYRLHDEYGLPIDASDGGAVSEYPFKGEGLEAFAMQAVRKERFIRTMIDTHFDFLFGRSMRYQTDERSLYRELWDGVHESGFTIKGLLRTLAMSNLYNEIDESDESDESNESNESK